MIEVFELTVKDVAGVEPKLTALAPVKPLPVMLHGRAARVGAAGLPPAVVTPETPGTIVANG